MLNQIFKTQESKICFAKKKKNLLCFWSTDRIKHNRCASYSAAAAAKSLQPCPTVRPHRRQPTRLLRPWDSPGKNTGVGCHCLLQCMKVKSESEVTSFSTIQEFSLLMFPLTIIQCLYKNRLYIRRKLVYYWLYYLYITGKNWLIIIK